MGDLPLGQDPVGHLVHRDDDARNVSVLGQADHANAEPAWPVRVHPAAQLGSHDRALGAESPTEERLDLVPVDEDGDVDQLRAGRNGRSSPRSRASSAESWVRPPCRSSTTTASEESAASAEK